MEDRVNALNERYENCADYSEIRGSEMMSNLMGSSGLAGLTNWKQVLPLEYKMHIVTMAKLAHEKSNSNDGGMIVDQRRMFPELYEWASKVPKRVYDDTNKCAVCMCELFPDPFFETGIEQLCDEQEFLIMTRLEGAQLNDHQKSQVGVVVLGGCTGEPHLFH